MPAERFFYRPVDPGYAQLGASIGSGIENAVGGYLDERDRKADRERQTQLDEERRKDLDYQRSRQRLFDDIALAEAGGARGRPPGAERYDMDFGEIGMARRGPGNILTRDIQLGPQPQEPGVVETAANDPDFGIYREIGAGDQRGYIMDPQVRMQREAQAEAGAELTAREAERNALRESILALNPDMDPNRATGEAGMMASGMADYPDFHPSASGTGSSNRTFTPNQAMEYLKDIYSEKDEFGNPLGYLMDPQTMYELADAMARGEPVELPDPSTLQPGMTDMAFGDESEGAEGPGFFENLFFRHNPFASSRGGAGVGGQPGQRGGMMEEGVGESGEGDVAPTYTPEQVSSVQDHLKEMGYPEDMWADALREAGFGDEEIRQIIGK